MDATPTGGQRDAALRPRTRGGKARLTSLDALDQRTAAAQAARRLIANLFSSMGGEDRLSEGERQLCQRAALVGAIVADFEARWVAGEPVPLPEYLSAVNVQRRVLATLGLRRVPKDIDGFDDTDPALQVYREALQRADDTSEAEAEYP
jgi:hypothetical protein